MLQWALWSHSPPIGQPFLHGYLRISPNIPSRPCSFKSKGTHQRKGGSPAAVLKSKLNTQLITPNWFYIVLLCLVSVCEVLKPSRLKYLIFKNSKKMFMTIILFIIEVLTEVFYYKDRNCPPLRKRHFAVARAPS